MYFVALSQYYCILEGYPKWSCFEIKCIFFQLWNRRSPHFAFFNNISPPTIFGLLYRLLCTKEFNLIVSDPYWKVFVRLDETNTGWLCDNCDITGDTVTGDEDNTEDDERWHGVMSCYPGHWPAHQLTPGHWDWWWWLGLDKTGLTTAQYQHPTLPHLLNT